MTAVLSSKRVIAQPKDIAEVKNTKENKAELAAGSEVSKRTIQQYEQRRKEINKAQSETVFRLSRALQCRMEELLEKVPRS